MNIAFCPDESEPQVEEPAEAPERLEPEEEVISDPYVCVECGAEFPTNAELDFHKRREHPPLQSYQTPRVHGESTSEEEDDFPFRYQNPRTKKKHTVHAGVW